MKLLSNQDRYIHFEKLKKSRGNGTQIPENGAAVNHTDEYLHILPNYFSILFPEWIWHNVCNKLSDNCRWG